MFYSGGKINKQLFCVRLFYLNETFREAKKQVELKFSLSESGLLSIFTLYLFSQNLIYSNSWWDLC